MNNLQAVLFDLDGTLLDTAPDFLTATNRLLSAKQRSVLHHDSLRQLVSNGSAGIIEYAFDLPRDHSKFEPLRQELLDFYWETLAEETDLFPGMSAVLEAINLKNLPWGIVTNKPERYTLEILRRKPINPAPQTIICPDHVRHTKPDPEPILLACAELGVAPENCVYVGDHLRDIEAGLRAGCTTIATLYGYLSETDKPEDWGAHHQVNNAAQITNILFPQA